MTPATEFVVAWLERAATRLDQSVGLLTDLDAARGDADHGVNMQRGFAAVADSLAARPPASPGDALACASIAIRRTIGGTSGPLWAVALRRMAKSVGDTDEPGLAAFASALEAAVAGVSELGDAQLGEGTMLDALAPAAAALRAAASQGAAFPDGLRQAAEAAERGAQQTARRAATKGRAAYLGQRGIGSPDPGAVSAAIVVAALAG